MAGEYAVPLLIVALILLVVASWRVVHPPLALALTAVVGVCAVAYLFFSVIPRFLAATDSLDVAAAPFEATARDARPNDMAIQLYRGSRLLGECALADPDAAPAPIRSAEPLRIERGANGSGYQVWSGATLVGDLPESSLAALDLGRSAESAPGPARSPEPPQFFLTGKVAVGDSFSLGRLSPAGAVTVQFVRLNERGLAVVKVDAPDLGPADPPTLELNNKSALTQSFERMHFDVAIREASFIADPPWAAFAVMAHP